MYYKAYNLDIYSELKLPELESNISGTDIIIKFGNINSLTENFEERNFSQDYNVRITNSNIYFLLNDLDICKISFGNEILLNPNTGIDASLLRVLILGPIMSILLHQRKNLILHSGASNINGEAVAFIGGNGSGKSTSILALHKNGYPIVTDDSLLINFNNDFPIVTPSYSRLKFRQDTMEFNKEEFGIMPKTHKYSEKYSYFAKNDFSQNPIPLKKIYILEKSNEYDLSSLNPSESLMRLIKNSYCYGIFSKKELIENLNNCSKIVKNIPIKLLKIQQSINELPELIRIIEEDNKHKL